MFRIAGETLNFLRERERVSFVAVYAGSESSQI